MDILYYNPGQVATIILEVFDGYTRTNTASLPQVIKITNPNLTVEDGYPSPMTNLETGIYYFKFTIPKTYIAVGSYLITVSYPDPATSFTYKKLYQVLVTAPYGIFNVST